MFQKIFFLQKTPIVFYSPYSVKFWKFVPDIIIKPGENKYGSFVDEFKFILFVKEFDNYWVSNCKDFGDESIDFYEKLEIKIENIQKASKRISDLFNNIKGKNKWFFQLESQYKFNDIKNLKKDELNKCGYFLEFIYWLVSDKISTEDKYKQLNKLFKEMGEDYFNNLSELLVDLSEIDMINKTNNYNKKQKEDINNYLLVDDSGAFFPNINEEKEEEEEENDCCIIVFYNILIKIRKYLISRYQLLKDYNFNVSKIFRTIEKPKYKGNKEICFPKFNEEKFIREVKEQMIIKKDTKNIKGKLSKTWLFNENKIEPELISKDFKQNDDFIQESSKIEGKGLNLNPDILKIKDLSEANSLNKIIMVLLYPRHLCFV